MHLSQININIKTTSVFFVDLITNPAVDIHKYMNENTWFSCSLIVFSLSQ